MTIPLALVVARRALVVAVVAVLVAIAALGAALLSSSDDPPANPADSQAQADVAAAQDAVVAAEAAIARAEDAASAARAAAISAEEAATLAQEGASMAQEAASMAFESSVEASVAATKVAAAEEPLAEAEDETGGATTDDAAVSEPATGDTEDATTEDPEGATTEEPTTEDTSTGDDGSEPAAADGTGDGSEQVPEDPAVDLPGEAFEFGPPAGAALAVVGVSHDSVLNVRDVPNGEIVARLDNEMNVSGQPVVYVRRPDSDGLIATLDLNRGVIATGNTRRLPTTIWHEIRMGDAVGWASSAFLSPLGATRDATAQIVAALGETPAAPTPAELGRVVAEAVASDEPPSRIVVSGAPVIGDLAEVTFDVLGLPDDAVRGFRLHIFAQQDSGSGPFALKTVESTTICDSYRGVSEEGLCN